MKIIYNPKLKEKARWLRNNMTLSEVLLWNRLKGGQMCNLDFHRQKPILNYIVDFFCAQLNLIIEVDGFSHNYKIEEDIIRDRKLQQLGLTTLRFQDIEVKTDIENVLTIIYNWVEEHTPRPSL